MRFHFNRNLINRSTKSLRLNHHVRRSVFYSSINNNLRIHMSLLLDFLQHMKVNLSCCVLLSIFHDVVDKLFRQRRRSFIHTKLFLDKLFLRHDTISISIKLYNLTG